MIRNIKALGLAFVAVAAMSMAAVSAAQASELHVTTQAEKAAITGEQTVGTEHVFQITPPNGPTTKCNQALFEGTVQRAGPGTQITAQELTLTATYTGCKSFGVAAQVRMNGCKYTITNKDTSIPPKTTALTAYVDITGCTPKENNTQQPPTHAIEVITAGCTITVPQQHHLSHLVFKNEGVSPKEDVHVNVTIQGIQYELHGAICGHATTVLTNDGKYEGLATFRAFEDLGTVEAEHNAHKYQKILDNLNVQYGLLAT